MKTLKDSLAENGGRVRTLSDRPRTIDTRPRTIGDRTRKLKDSADLNKIRELAGLSVTEAMISGDWEKLGITNDEIAKNKDDVFPGVWSVGRGGPNSEMFYFNEPNTSGHFATIVDIGRGTFKVEDATGQALSGASDYKRNRGTFGLSWADAEAVVGKMLLGKRSEHDETPSSDEYR